jgi:hypothetical protein
LEKEQGSETMPAPEFPKADPNLPQVVGENAAAVKLSLLQLLVKEQGSAKADPNLPQAIGEIAAAVKLMRREDLKSLPYAIVEAQFDRLTTLSPDQRTPAQNAALIKADQAIQNPDMRLRALSDKEGVHRTAVLAYAVALSN